MKLDSIKKYVLEIPEHDDIIVKPNSYLARVNKLIHFDGILSDLEEIKKYEDEKYKEGFEDAWEFVKGCPREWLALDSEEAFDSFIDDIHQNKIPKVGEEWETKYGKCLVLDYDELFTVMNTEGYLEDRDLDEFFKPTGKSYPKIAEGIKEFLNEVNDKK